MASLEPAARQQITPPLVIDAALVEQMLYVLLFLLEKADLSAEERLDARNMLTEVIKTER